MPRIPSATYRLQFHAGFTFRDAQSLLDYLDELGVSDLYCSPYFQASPESTHGYDVSDHNRLNPAIGGDSDFRALVAELQKRGMGQVLDFVPNHMGIAESVNEWWMSVLEEGIDSPFASYFDIDWHPAKEQLARRILLPILGDRYGRVLEGGAFKLQFVDGAFFLQYFQTRLPLNPRSYPQILRRALLKLDAGVQPRLKQVIEMFGERQGAAGAKEALAQLAAEEPPVMAAVAEALLRLEGEPESPESFDALHDLLEAQAYRLSYWRVAAEEINYRRFFDINTLAAIRVEIPEVFEAAHQFVLKLLAAGDVTGLRIDHIDGLWDPRGYLERLQERHRQLAGQDLYVLVEKILDPVRERLPAGWPVHGTTGYEFANQVAMLLVDSSAERKFTRTFQKFTGVTDDFPELVYEKKKLTMQISLSSEVAGLGRMLDELSEMHRHFRDFSRNTLTAAVREVIACFPVYRTYVTGPESVSPEDEKIVLRAIHAARRRNPSIEKPVFDFLRGVLLLRLPENLSPAQQEAHVRFVMKFQQCSGPVMAKGLEDTALYIYNRLTALNEVGGHPGLFGIEPAEFHRLNAERADRLPHGLLASSTHDTKRSEDVRMRLAALSEMPREWREAVNTWSLLNRKLRTRIGGEFAPSRNEEYFLYQTLVGAWPIDRAHREDFVERIQEYMMKALKEAKINSSWTEPNEEWEGAVARFIARILGEEKSSRFLASLQAFVEIVAPLGAMNSLSQTVLKCVSPGVPDTYQGTEVWDFSLVDPDNRRPVDFDKHGQLLASLPGLSPDWLVAQWKTGAIKLHILQRLLRWRRENTLFFQKADYAPLEALGAFARHVVAFSRSFEGRRLLAVVPRLTAPLGSFPRGGVWTDTALDLPAGNWRNVLTKTTVKHDGGTWPVGGILAELPVAVFANWQAAART